MTEPTAPFVVHKPDLDALDPLELVALAYEYRYWARPDQQIPAPSADWASFGFIAGRGHGKTTVIAQHINAAVERGEYRSIAFGAPTEDRAAEVQWKTLIETAPPWFKPEVFKDKLTWPNGVYALVFTPEAPGRPRGENLDLVWMTELVDWQATTRLELHANLALALRVGCAQMLWDTTSKGKNELIQRLLENHERDPQRHRLQRGTAFDNFFLKREVLADLCRMFTGRQYDEEILGLVFQEAEGALWQQAWLDDHRRTLTPSDLELVLVSIDPAQATGIQNDETGIVIGGRAPDSELYVMRDRSDRHAAEAWGDIAVEECERGAAGVILERNHAGDLGVAVLRARAERKGFDVRVLRKDQPFPRRAPGIIYVREHWSAASKGTRAGGPAALYETGRVHHVGTLPQLEYEQTTFEPGTRKSPNRLDACAYLIIELAGLVDNRPSPQARRQQAAATKQAAGQLQAQLRGIRVNRRLW